MKIRILLFLCIAIFVVESAIWAQDENADSSTDQLLDIDEEQCLEITIDIEIEGYITNAGEVLCYWVTVQGTEPLFIHLDKTTGWNGHIAVYKSSLDGEKVGDNESPYDQMLQIDNVEPDIYYVTVQGDVVSKEFKLKVRRSLDVLMMDTPEPGEINHRYGASWYQVEVTGTEPLFVYLDKNNAASAWIGYLAAYKGSLNGERVGDNESPYDQMLQIDDVEPDIYYIMVRQRTTSPVYYSVEVKRNLDELVMDIPQQGEVPQRYDASWHQVELDTTGPLVIIAETTANCKVELRIKKDVIPNEPPYWHVSGTGHLEVGLLVAEAGTYYIQILCTAGGGGYTILANTDINKATKPLILDNEVIAARVSAARACVTSLVFKPGTNQEVVHASRDRYLIDFGSQDPELKQYFKTGWQAQILGWSANHVQLQFTHSSGFENQLSLIWDTGHVEVRAYIIAPEPVEIDNNIAPGAGFHSGDDKWAVPAVAGVQMGSFTYPGSEAWIYPSSNPDDWIAPSGGWMAFWNEDADEVHGFTFSEGYELQVANSDVTDLHFVIPAGMSQISFQLFKPKPVIPYEAIELMSGPYFSLTNEVDKLFAGVGAELYYTLGYGNTGAGEATEVILENVLPSELEVDEASISDGGFYDPIGHSITWNIPALPAGSEMQTATFMARIVSGVPNGTRIVNEARIRSAEEPIATVAEATMTVGTPEIMSISPDRGGNTGSVTVRIEGQYIDPNAQVKLLKSGQVDISAISVIGSPDGETISATFDLTDKTSGIYDLIVINSDGSSAILQEAFCIDSGGVVDLWVDIIAGQVRAGKPKTFIIQCGNSGNVNADYPHVFIAFPNEITFELVEPFSQMIPSGYPDPLADDPTAIHMSVIGIPALPPQSVHSIPIRVTAPRIGKWQVYMGITSDLSIVYSSELSFASALYEELVGEEDGESSSVMKETLNLGNWRDKNTTDSPPAGYIMFWSCDYGPCRPGQTDGKCGVYWHMAKSIDGGDFVEILGGPDPKPDIQKHNLKDFPDYWHPHYKHWIDWSHGCDKWEYWGAYRMPGHNSKYENSVKERARKLFKEYENKSKYNRDFCQSKFEPGKLIETSCWGLVLALNYDKIYRDNPKKWVGPHQLYNEVRDKGNNEPDWYERMGRPWEDKPWKGKVRPDMRSAYYKHWDDLRRKCFEKLKRQIEKFFYSVSSISPEDKYGPAGYDPKDTEPGQLNRFVQGNKPFEYRIDFWNKEDAPVPTQDVFIEDQLDSNLDWDTFEFRDFGFLKWDVTVPPGQKELDETIDLRPDMSLLVRVQANIDSGGMVRWTFSSIDPYTGEPPEDPDAGFLPPITESGYEIGWVNFIVEPKDGLTTGDQISNQAFVKFDVGPWKPAPPNPDSEIPGYGPWVNTIDSGAPTSHVRPLPEDSSSTFAVEWEGTDDEGGSGVGCYTIYVSEDGIGFDQWLFRTSDTSAQFTGERDHTYYFYSRAEDNVGNVEEAPEAPDAFTKVTVSHWTLISIPYLLADNSLNKVLESIEGHYGSVWSYVASTKEWKRHFVNGPAFINNLYTIEAGKGYYIEMFDSTPLNVVGSEVADDPIDLLDDWNLVGYNSLESKSCAEALVSISGFYDSVWSYNLADVGWDKYVAGWPEEGNDLETMEPWKGYWINANTPCSWDVNNMSAPAAPSVAGRANRRQVVRKRPQLPYTIWGSIEADGMEITRKRDCTVILKINDEVHNRYKLGTLEQYGDYYVIDVPEDTDSSAQIELYVKIDADTVKAANVPRSEAGRAIQFDLSVDMIPETSMLRQNYPNPFNPDTWIPYQLSKDSHVEIRIFSVTGQLVRTLDLGRRPAGFYTSKEKAAYWDGRNETGESVASGVYFYSINAGGLMTTRKMVVTK